MTSCTECPNPLPQGSRADRLTCSPACRVRRHRRLHPRPSAAQVRAALALLASQDPAL